MHCIDFLNPSCVQYMIILFILFVAQLGFSYASMNMSNDQQKNFAKQVSERKDTYCIPRVLDYLTRFIWLLYFY